jgi:hypothetical protein
LAYQLIFTSFFSGGNRKDLKVGFQGRTLINDFDVTIHFVQEQIKANESSQQRLVSLPKGM